MTTLKSRCEMLLECCLTNGSHGAFDGWCWWVHFCFTSYAGDWWSTGDVIIHRWRHQSFPLLAQRWAACHSLQILATLLAMEPRRRWRRHSPIQELLKSDAFDWAQSAKNPQEAPRSPWLEHYLMSTRITWIELNVYYYFHKHYFRGT